jgi:hypothetical protein
LTTVKVGISKIRMVLWPLEGLCDGCLHAAISHRALTSFSEATPIARACIPRESRRKTRSCSSRTKTPRNSLRTAPSSHASTGAA